MALTLFLASIDHEEYLCPKLIRTPTGEVVQGMDLVKKIESLGSMSGTTNKKIVIAECGTV